MQVGSLKTYRRPGFKVMDARGGRWNDDFLGELGKCLDLSQLGEGKTCAKMGQENPFLGGANHTFCDSFPSAWLLFLFGTWTKCWRAASSLLAYDCRGWILAISYISRHQTVRTNIWQTSTAIQKKSWELRFLVPVFSNRCEKVISPVDASVWGCQFQSQGFFTVYVDLCGETIEQQSV